MSNERSLDVLRSLIALPARVWRELVFIQDLAVCRLFAQSDKFESRFVL